MALSRRRWVHQSEDMSTYLAATPPTQSRRNSWALSLVLLLVAAVAFGAGYALGSHPDTTPARSSVAQLASVESGCNNWAASAPPTSASSGWCSGMVGWMSDRMGHAMMGSGMWAGPGQLRASCRQWADDSPDQSGDSAASTCDDMVAWMDGHAENGWGMWTMHGR